MRKRKIEERPKIGRAYRRTTLPCLRPSSLPLKPGIYYQLFLINDEKLEEYIVKAKLSYVDLDFMHTFEIIDKSGVRTIPCLNKDYGILWGVRYV